MDGNDPATVLLVEGDPLIRMPLAGYLRDCGYRVIECVSGDEALVVIIEQAIRIDVVLIDVQLPGALNGFGLARHITERRPTTKTMVMGTPVSAATAAAEICAAGPQPGKHYDHQSIANRIRGLLADRRLKAE